MGLINDQFGLLSLDFVTLRKIITRHILYHRSRTVQTTLSMPAGLLNSIDRIIQHNDVIVLSAAVFFAVAPTASILLIIRLVKDRDQLLFED